MKNRIVAINTVFNGSTGNIMIGIQTEALKSEFEYYVCATHFSSIPNGLKNYIRINSHLSETIHYYLGTFFGLQGYGSYISTKKLIKHLKIIKPEIIHLHNLHNCYINEKLLFSYIKNNNIKVIWTLHDCWPMTGKCPHFMMANCDKWKNGCKECDHLSEYPEMKMDKTSILWKKKKEEFNIDDLTLVAPSKWMQDIVKQSYLKNHDCTVIYNGIKLNTFKINESNFKKNNNLENKKIILGVSFIWNLNKGIDVFIELSKRLPNNYVIVLVGTNDDLDKLLPNNIISIHKTTNVDELLEIYNAADVLFNPTREEVFGLVNVEALACGTPVVAFNTGGCPEIINSIEVGSIVKSNTVEESIDRIIEVIENNKTIPKKCVERARDFDVNNMYKSYISLYNRVLKN